MTAKTKKTVAALQDAQPTAPAVAAETKRFEPKATPVFSVEADSVSVQERTKKVPLPAQFHLEAAPVSISKPKGHQVDPSRPEGCAPVMPNTALLAAAGNPYPLVADETVVTADRYKPFVAISHHTFERLKAAGEFYSADRDAIATILAEAGVNSTADSLMCVKDTLRDLALYGLAQQFVVGRARLFRLP